MNKKHAYKCIKKKGIQMYEKKHAYKHVYKCMKKTQMYEKTCIQTCIQMYETKQAYICMMKTYIQMYEKAHTNVRQKHAYKHVYKCMKKNA